MESRTAPNTSPSRVSYGVSFVRSSKKYDRDTSRAHYIPNVLEVEDVFHHTYAGMFAYGPLTCWNNYDTIYVYIGFISRSVRDSSHHPCYDNIDKRYRPE